MIDVKKLITGFLILATASVCSGLILALVNTASFAPTTTTHQPTIIIGSSALGTNGFLPSEADVQEVIAAVASDLPSSTMMQSSTDPSNLTDVLATEFVNGVASANPNGPTNSDANGNPIITTPNINSIASNVASANITQNLQIPDWDVEAAEVPISVAATSGASAIFQYGSAINNILSSHLNDQVQSIVSNDTGSANTDDISYVKSQIQNALGDTASLKTPAPAVAYQKSLVKVLVYEKNMLQLANAAQTDPVKASLIFQDEDQKFQLAQEDFQNQAQIITNATVSLQPTPQKQKNLILSFMGNTFGVPEAHALWPVFDPATWGLIEANEGETIAHELEAMLKNTLLQILKNTLIAIIQQKVLAWVQGSGAPRFITNWGTTLINAAQTSAINSINKEMSCGVYPAFVPQIKINLKAFYLPGNSTCANQFAAALGSNSFQQFYNNFSNGGFVAFGASTLPSGNPYAQQFFSAQAISVSVQNTQQSTALKTQASGGFKGGDVCDDGSDPNNGEHTVCENPDGPDYTLNSTSSGGTETNCGTGDTSVVYANQGTCSDGSNPQVTTPSAVTGFALNQAMGGTPQQVAAANDIVGVLNSVLSSLMTSLASTAVNAAGKFVNQELTAVNPSSITAGAATPPPAQIPLACNPSSQTIPSAAASGSPLATSTSTSTSTSPITVSASGGTTDANGNSPSYNWTDSNGVTSTGAFFSDAFPNPGTYTVTLTDSVASDKPATCTVIVQP